MNLFKISAKYLLFKFVISILPLLIIFNANLNKGIFSYEDIFLTSIILFFLILIIAFFYYLLRLNPNKNYLCDLFYFSLFYYYPFEKVVLLTIQYLNISYTFFFFKFVILFFFFLLIFIFFIFLYKIKINLRHVNSIFLMIFIFNFFYLILFVDFKNQNLSDPEISKSTFLVNSNENIHIFNQKPDIFLVNLDGFGSKTFFKYQNQINLPSINNFFLKNKTISEFSNYPTSFDSNLSIFESSYLKKDLYNNKRVWNYAHSFKNVTFLEKILKYNGYKIQSFDCSRDYYQKTHACLQKKNHISTLSNIKYIHFSLLEIVKINSFLKNFDINSRFFLTNEKKTLVSNSIFKILSQFQSEKFYPNFFHIYLPIPHKPYDLDRNCNFKIRSNKNVNFDANNSYFEHVECSIKVANFLDAHFKKISENYITIYYSDNGPHNYKHATDKENVFITRHGSLAVMVKNNFCKVEDQNIGHVNIVRFMSNCLSDSNYLLLNNHYYSYVGDFSFKKIPSKVNIENILSFNSFK